jgi:hypothetical protein
MTCGRNLTRHCRTEQCEPGEPWKGASRVVDTCSFAPDTGRSRHRVLNRGGVVPTGIHSCNINLLRCMVLKNSICKAKIVSAHREGFSIVSCHRPGSWTFIHAKTPSLCDSLQDPNIKALDKSQPQYRPSDMRYLRVQSSSIVCQDSADVLRYRLNLNANRDSPASHRNSIL